MDFSIHQQCPSCGAGIVLHEDDRLIRCEYCDVSNYRIDAVLRYALPVQAQHVIAPDELIYIPYIRLKGTLLTVTMAGVQHRILDTTCAAVSESAFAPSLGLKPQAMSVLPVLGASEGRFLARKVDAKEIFAHAVRVSELFGSKKLTDKILQRQFIGETVSWIYHPYLVRDGKLYDGISGRSAGSADFAETLLANTQSSSERWDPRFIATHCPSCGGLLGGERDSLVLACDNCHKHWHELRGAFKEVDYYVTASSSDNAYYLPFWEILLGQEGELANYGDYLRFTNQPRVVQDRDDKTPLKIFVPAFKINPKSFIQLASHMTMSQNKLPERRFLAENTFHHMLKTGAEDMYPVTLGQKEAVQTMKAVIAMTTIDKKRSLPRIAGMKLSITALCLNYIPFIPMNHDYVQEVTGGAVSRAALRYGRSL